MNILFFLPSVKNRGGVERATISLLNSLVKNTTNTIFLLVFNYDESEVAFEIDKNVVILNLEITNYKNQFLTLFIKISKEVKRNNITHFIIVETMGLLFTFLPLFFISKRPKIIVWEHFNFYNNNGRKLRKFFRKLAARYADLIVTLTARDVNTWKENLKIKNKITYIYNISPFENIKATYNTDSKKVISVGRYVEVKGFDRLIQTWSILENKYDIRDWKLSIIGYGEQRVNLQDLIDNLACKSIELVDGSTNVIDQYKEASIYCMTSYFEGLPMVLIEAQSFGLPAISFDIYSGPSEILENGSGLLIKDNDLEAYADGLYRLMSSELVRKQLSEEALLNCVNFKGERIANVWLDKLQKL
ncbi:glycosyltransferase family 4 protein [Empedobacter falsenii]